MSPYLIAILVLFGLMWLLLIRPQRRRQAEHAAMLDRLQVGDEVLTAAGLYGRVRAIADDEVTIEIAPGTNARFDRRAVAAIIEPEAPQEALPEGEQPSIGDNGS